MDDVQFISGKSETQNKLFDIINTFLENKKRVILAADREPCNIDGISECLYRRFTGGLVGEITLPEYEIRYSIVKNTAKKFELDIPEKTIKYIADKITDNISQLRGVTNSICANCNFCGLSPTIELAEKVISQI